MKQHSLDELGASLLGLILAWNVAQGALLQFAAIEPGAQAGGAAYLAGVGLSLWAHRRSRRAPPGIRGPRAEAVASPRRRWRSLAREAVIAAAGPVLLLLFALLAVMAARVAYVVGAADPLVRSLAAVATFDLVWGVVNLLPVRPLDGGRLLHVALEACGRAPLRARKDLGVVTEAAAWLVIAAGLASGLGASLADGLSWIMVGLILLAEGRTERERADHLAAATSFHAAASASAASTFAAIFARGKGEGRAFAGASKGPDEADAA